MNDECKRFAGEPLPYGLVNCPYSKEHGVRVVGFKIRPGDEAYGKSGLSELLERISNLWPANLCEVDNRRARIAITELRSKLATPPACPPISAAGEEVKFIGLYYGEPIMTASQHRQQAGKLAEALRLIASADPLVVTPKYRIAASEALADWEKTNGN